MRFELSHDKRTISDGGLLSDLRRVASEQPQQQVKQRTYKELGKYGVTTIIRRFGSWNAAVKAAGLETTVERSVSDEKLFSALYDLWVMLGRQPSYSEVQSPACPFHVTTYERRFGSWRQSLEVFVSYANSEEMTPPPLERVPNRQNRKGDSRNRRNRDSPCWLEWRPAWWQNPIRRIYVTAWCGLYWQVSLGARRRAALMSVRAA